jgi:hypothetical protein
MVSGVRMIARTGRRTEMGMVLVIGMMLYAFGLCHLLGRMERRSARLPGAAHGSDDVDLAREIPDRVPDAWVKAYRSDPGS